MFFAAIGASKGVRAAAPARAGYHSATFVATTLIGFGLGAALLNDPVVVRVLATIGSGYVLWLAWAFIRSARSQETSPYEAPGELCIGFWSEAVVPLLNPKASYTIAVMFTQVSRPSLNDGLVSVMTITLVVTINNLVAFTVWTLVAPD